MLLKRKESKNFRKYQNIDLYFLNSLNEDAWLNQPDSFSDFLRFNFSHEKHIEEALKKKLRYEEIGCFSLAKETQKTIENIENYNKMYYGFHKIDIVSVAVVLVKKLDFIFESKKISVKSNYKNRDDLDRDFLRYEPRVYPLCEFWDMASDSFRDNINNLKNFPEASGLPIFDRFGLVIPSIDLVVKDPLTGLYYFRDESGLKQIFSSKEEASNELDRFLFKNNLINSVVVAEKNSNYYFIGDFN